MSSPVFLSLDDIYCTKYRQKIMKIVSMPIQDHGGGVPDHFTASGPLPMASAQEKGKEKTFPPPQISKWCFLGPCYCRRASLTGWYSTSLNDANCHLKRKPDLVMEISLPLRYLLTVRFCSQRTDKGTVGFAYVIEFRCSNSILLFCINKCFCFGCFLCRLDSLICQSMTVEQP